MTSGWRGCNSYSPRTSRKNWASPPSGRVTLAVSSTTTGTVTTGIHGPLGVLDRSSVKGMVAGHWRVMSVALVEVTTGRASTRRGLTRESVDVRPLWVAVALTGDGRYAAFTSRANNLVADDENGVTDIFLRDSLNGQTERVSLTTRVLPTLPGRVYMGFIARRED